MSWPIFEFCTYISLESFLYVLTSLETAYQLSLILEVLEESILPPRQGRYQVVFSEVVRRQLWVQ